MPSKQIWSKSDLVLGVVCKQIWSKSDLVLSVVCKQIAETDLPHKYSIFNEKEKKKVNK